MSIEVINSDEKKYEAIKILGEGGFGTVLLAYVTSKLNGEPITTVRAAKVFKDVNIFFLEKENLEKLKKIPYLNKLYGSWYAEDTIDPNKKKTIVMDFYKDNLSTYNFIGMPFNTFNDKIILTLITLVMVMYEKNLYYTDMKPENILYNGTDIILGDLGSIVYIDNDSDVTNLVFGSQKYKSLHTFSTNRYNIRIMTLYALALTLIELICNYSSSNFLSKDDNKKWCLTLQTLNLTSYNKKNNPNANISKEANSLYKKYSKNLIDSHQYYDLNIKIVNKIENNIKNLITTGFVPIFDIIRYIFEELRDNKDLSIIFNKIRIKMLDICIDREVKSTYISSMSRGDNLIKARKTCEINTKEINASFQK